MTVGTDWDCRAGAPEHVEPLPSAAPALASSRSAGIPTAVVPNRSGMDLLPVPRTTRALVGAEARA